VATHCVCVGGGGAGGGICGRMFAYFYHDGKSCDVASEIRPCARGPATARDS
jgi:hypothetical protein